MPLISTRFKPPILRKDTISRTRLLQQLQPNEASGRSLCLLTAPAGYGKSILMSQFYHAFADADWHTAWLTLEETDNDLQSFSLYFKELFTELTKGSKKYKKSTGDSRIELGGNEKFTDQTLSRVHHMVLHGPAKQILFFDDFHLVENTVLHDFFRQFLTCLPNNLLVVIGSRIQLPIPLAKLRASNQIISFGIDDMCFDAYEGKQLFDCVKPLEINAEDLNFLYNKTGGWPAVMQLTAISLKVVSDRNIFIENFSSSIKPVFEFLYEEVIAMMTRSTADFLMRISIADRLCPELCLAITAQQKIVSDLDSLNVLGCLVQGLGSDGHWFRLHPIIREVLLKQLALENPQEFHQLHNRAALWFEDKGLVGEAIQHAISANNEAHALELLEENGMQLINAGYIGSLSSIIRRLPQKTLLNSLGMLYQVGWLHILSNRLPQAEKLMQQIQSVLEDQCNDDGVLWSRLIELECGICNFGEDYLRGTQLAEKWLPQVPASEVRVQGTLRLMLAYTNLNKNDYGGALEQARWVLSQLGQETIDLTRSYAASVRSIVFYHRGLLKQSQLGLEVEQKQLARNLGVSSQAIIIIESMRAANFYHQGELIKAHAIFNKRDREHLKMVPADHLLVIVPVRARVYEHCGSFQQALDYLLEIQLLAQERGWQRLEFSVINELVRLYLSLGEFESAKSIYQCGKLQLNDLSGQLPFIRQQIEDYFGIIQGRMLAAQGDFIGADLQLEKLRVQAHSSECVLRIVQICVLQAKFFCEGGHPVRAVKALVAAFKLDRENSLIQLFRDEGEKVLTLLADHYAEIVVRPDHTIHQLWQNKIQLILQNENAEAATSAPVMIEATAQTGSGEYQQMVETLSKRELQILEKLVCGFSNKQISESLNISVNTVKTHLYTCYGKLGVSRRTEAVMRLKLLGFFI